MLYWETSNLQADPPATPLSGSENLPGGQVRLLDEALDYTARLHKATVGEFLAAPAAIGPALEIAVEFFVPPCSTDAFAHELDRALARRSMEYGNARRTGQSQPLRLQVLPPGAFHQWRSAWKIDPRQQHAKRLCADRLLLDGILHQAQIGWREFLHIG